MTVKMTIHTMSTKCQYRPAISTASRVLLRRAGPASSGPRAISSQTMPIVTCAPWRPVSTKKRRAEQVRVEVQALAVELGELEDLAADERQPEQRGGEQPDPEPAVVAALDRGEREHHRERAHQQDERRHRRERDVEQRRFGVGPCGTARRGRGRGSTSR